MPDTTDTQQAASVSSWAPLSAVQQKALVRMEEIGEYTTVELAELFEVSRAPAYRVLERVRGVTV